MNIRIFLLSALVCIALASSSQVVESGQMVLIQGFIAGESGNRIENVHIVNLSRGQGTTSNFDGLFNLGVSPGDTLRFTCVGYIPAKYNVPFYVTSPILPVQVILKIDTLQISGANIYPWPADAAALKKAILAMDDQTPKQPDLKLNDKTYKKTDLPQSVTQQSIPGMSNPGLTYVVPGPITAIYDAFSKSGKSKRKLNMLESADERKVIASRRYNANVVRNITSFTSEKEIQDFMLFCNLNVDFIVTSSEYELYLAIHECLLAFNAQKPE